MLFKVCCLLSNGSVGNRLEADATIEATCVTECECPHTPIMYYSIMTYDNDMPDNDQQVNRVMVFMFIKFACQRCTISVLSIVQKHLYCMQSYIIFVFII